VTVDRPEPDHTQPHRSLLSQPFDGGQLAVVRRWVDKLAAEVGLPAQRRADFVLAVDEVITNAVRHGGGHGHLDVWAAQRRLWFLVTDTGPGLAVPVASRAPEPTVVGGRGLWITRQLTDDFTIATGPFGTTVTAAVDLPPASSALDGEPAGASRSAPQQP
jgi:anti-sigma regulatory factor (Ser/Thr protein kinase)